MFPTRAPINLAKKEEVRTFLMTQPKNLIKFSMIKTKITKVLLINKSSVMVVLILNQLKKAQSKIKTVKGKILDRFLKEKTLY